MSQVTLSLVLTLHLLCVSVASAGPLVSGWLDWRAARGSCIAWQAARFLSQASLALLVAGAILGLGLGWIRWSVEFQQLLLVFADRIRWGVWELIFSAALMSIHAWLVWRAPARSFLSSLPRCGLALLASTNLLYHFPILFIVLAEVSSGVLQSPARVNAASFRELMFEGSVMAQTVHFWLASLAVTGVVLMAYGGWLMRDAARRDDGSRVAAWGSRVALAPTMLQLVAGLWLVSKLPAAGQQQLLGGDAAAAMMLGLSIMGALMLMHRLAAVALGIPDLKSVALACGLLVAVVMLMTMTSRRLHSLNAGVVQNIAGSNHVP